MLRKEQTEEFIKEFLFFFSLLTRKKEAKKEKLLVNPLFWAAMYNPTVQIPQLQAESKTEEIP